MNDNQAEILIQIANLMTEFSKLGPIITKTEKLQHEVNLRRLN